MHTALPFIEQVIQFLPVFYDFCLLSLNGGYHVSLGPSQSMSLLFEHFHLSFNNCQVSLQIIVFPQKRLDPREITAKIITRKHHSLKTKNQYCSFSIEARDTKQAGRERLDNNKTAIREIVRV